MLAAAGGGVAARAARAGEWTTPAPLGACAALESARIVFPSDSPSHATGPGAVVWRGSPTCARGEGARLARVGAGDVPGAESLPLTAAGARVALEGRLDASVAPHGQLLLASAPEAGAGQLAIGAAGGPFTPSGGVTAPFALAHGYLGDVALAAPTRAGRLSLRIERYFATGLSSRAVPATATPDALALALDYRTDALVAWLRGGALFARWLPASGGTHSAQRLASGAAGAHVSLLLSDDNRATVAFSIDRAGSTSVYLARSGTGVRFGAPALLERFRDPPGSPPPAASPRLVRLSSESVMIAWAGAGAGHWVLRTAAIDQRGIGPAATIAAPGGDALLDDLAPGPAGDAIVLWSEPQGGRAGGTPEAAIYAARGFDAYPDRTLFAAPQQLAPPGPNDDASVAIDPADDSALAVWRGAGEALRYAIRAGRAGG